MTRDLDASIRTDAVSAHRDGRRGRIGLFVTALTVAIASACSSSSTSTSSSTTSTSSAGTSSSLATTIAAARWGNNVTVKVSGTSIEIRSDGLPNHDRQAEYALPNDGVVVPDASTAHAGADPTVAQNYDFSIPATPTKASTTTQAPLGTIGIMISGAAMYNPYEGDAATVAMASNFTVKDSAGKSVAFLDSCNGHPTPMGAYHYHALPKCITSVVDGASGPSHIIGIAFDGYPIYGNRDANGQVIAASQLDDCNGITSPTPEFPKGVYHYVLLDTADSRSSIRCFTGVVDSSLTQTMPGMGGKP